MKSINPPIRGSIGNSTRVLFALFWYQSPYKGFNRHHKVLNAVANECINPPIRGSTGSFTQKENHTGRYQSPYKGFNSWGTKKIHFSCHWACINPPIRGSIVRKSKALIVDDEAYQSPYKGFNSYGYRYWGGGSIMVTSYQSPYKGFNSHRQRTKQNENFVSIPL